MTEYTSVALKKIGLLIRKEDFVRIDEINSNLVTIVFKYSVCKVCNFGKVKWIDSESEE